LAGGRGRCGNDVYNRYSDRGKDQNSEQGEWRGLDDPDGARRGLADSAPVFAALGDPTRLGLVARLCASGPMSEGQWDEALGRLRQSLEN